MCWKTVEHSKDCDDEDTAVVMEQVEEHRATGSVTYKTYWKFFRAGLPAILIVLLVLTFGAGQGGCRYDVMFVIILKLFI